MYNILFDFQRRCEHMAPKLNPSALLKPRAQFCHSEWQSASTYVFLVGNYYNLFKEQGIVLSTKSRVFYQLRRNGRALSISPSFRNTANSLQI